MQRVAHRLFYSPLGAPVPWWGSLLLGVAAVAVGVAITTRPFTSLGVLVALVAAALLIAGISGVTSGDSGAVRLAGAAMIIAAAAVAVWPGISIRALAVLVGVSLLVGGAVRVVGGSRGHADERLIATVSGLTRVIFGALALAWPDLTVLVVALLVGPAMIVFGLGECASALRRRSGAAPGPRRHWPQWLRLAGVTASLVIALGLLLVSVLVHRSSPTSFYVPARPIPQSPGVLLRSEPMTQGIPSGAQAWRILYTTTGRHGQPEVASAIVVESRHLPSGPRPVIAWAHGTTGYATGCAPSLLKEPFTAGAMPALPQVIDHGWVVVATDYTGLGTAGPQPYLIGQLEARSVLDSVRAARTMKQVDLSNRTVIWGHSQGGGAALWAGILAGHYAPSADVVGVAAVSPATELPEIVNAAKDTPVGEIMGSYVVSAYSAIYSNVKFDDYIRPAAQVIAHRTAGRCLAGPEALVSGAAAASTESIFSASPATGALGHRLSQNIPIGHIRAPLFIGQGLADTLVLPSYQAQYVHQECALHQRLLYHTYKGFDHVSVVRDPRSPLIDDLLKWTEARFERQPQPSGCHTETS